MVVWGGLTNSCEKKRSESKGEKGRYKHLNAEFQRIASRDKKAFLSDQWKQRKTIEWEFGKLSSGHRTGKGQFSFQSQRKAMLMNARATAQLFSSHMLVKYAQNSPSQTSTIHEP